MRARFTIGGRRGRARPGWLLSVALSAGVLGSCGGSSSADNRFRNAFAAQEAAIVATGTQLNAVLQSGTHGRRLTRQLRPIAAGADKDVMGLQTLRPPADLAGDFNALRSALARAATDLHAMVEALSGRDRRAARQSLLVDSTTVKSTRQKLDKELGVKAG